MYRVPSESSRWCRGRASSQRRLASLGVTSGWSRDDDDRGGHDVETPETGEDDVPSQGTARRLTSSARTQPASVARASQDSYGQPRSDPGMTSAMTSGWSRDDDDRGGHDVETPETGEDDVPSQGTARRLTSSARTQPASVARASQDRGTQPSEDQVADESHSASAPWAGHESSRLYTERRPWLWPWPPTREGPVAHPVRKKTYPVESQRRRAELPRLVAMPG